jgi:hypothetical protein
VECAERWVGRTWPSVKNVEMPLQYGVSQSKLVVACCLLVGETKIVAAESPA